MAAPMVRTAVPMLTISAANAGVGAPLRTPMCLAGADCGSRLCTIIRCLHCKLDDLDDMRNHSHAGRLFERLLELEFDAQHFSIPWTDVTAEEVKGLQILKEERERYQREQMKKQPNGFPS
jgi:hypothetical protein